LSQLKKNHTSGNLISNILGIGQSLKLPIFMEKKILSISLKPNFTPNTLGCFGLRLKSLSSCFFSEHREQMNAATAFLDGSAIYGNNEEELNKIRDPQSGRVVLEKCAQ